MISATTVCSAAGWHGRTPERFGHDGLQLSFRDAGSGTARAGKRQLITRPAVLAEAVADLCAAQASAAIAANRQLHAATHAASAVPPPRTKPRLHHG
jgi:hypothetical protein